MSVPDLVVILSGGVDSTTLMYKARAEDRRPLAITFDYGQRHKREIACARDICARTAVPHRVISLADMGALWGASSALTSPTAPLPQGAYDSAGMKRTVVPNRNMIFLAMAIACASVHAISEVWYGAHAGDQQVYPDCRPAFINAMDAAARLCDYQEIRVRAPFQTWSKADVVALGARLGVDFAATWTCYRGAAEPCQQCSACHERRTAFASVGVADTLVVA